MSQESFLLIEGRLFVIEFTFRIKLTLEDIPKALKFWKWFTLVGLAHVHRVPESDPDRAELHVRPQNVTEKP